MKTLKRVVLTLSVVPLIALGQVGSDMTSPQADAKTQLLELEWLAGLWGGEVEGVGIFLNQEASMTSRLYFWMHLMNLSRPT